MKKSYRVKREGDKWVPQWVDAGDVYDGWHYYTYTEGERKGERIKFPSSPEAHTWLDEQKKKEAQEA